MKFHIRNLLLIQKIKETLFFAPDLVCLECVTKRQLLIAFLHSIAHWNLSPHLKQKPSTLESSEEKAKFQAFPKEHATFPSKPILLGLDFQLEREFTR